LIMARELLGTPATPAPPAPRARVEAAAAEPRRAPIATRDAPAAVTIIRPIELHDENEKS